MGLTVKAVNLASRLIRKVTTNGKVRKYAPKAQSINKDKKGNIISKIFGMADRFAGSILSGLWKALSVSISWSFSALWSGIVAATQFIYNFNWNTTDKELDETASKAFDPVFGQLGATLGNATGYLMCGALPGLAIMAFNEPMGLYILEEVGEEALEELVGNLAVLVRQTFNASVTAGFAYMYKNIRYLWRASDDDFKAKMKKQGMKVENINKAIEERNKPWSIAKVVEDAVEAIPNKHLRAFAEEFLEEFGESCIEAGYVVAGSLDSYFAQQKLANASLFGVEKTVEVTFTDDDKVETKIVKVPTKLEIKK